MTPLSQTIKILTGRLHCFSNRHDWQKEKETPSGDWIRCSRCGWLDKNLPGLREPKGYKK